jgi:hypothetical protein
MKEVFFVCGQYVELTLHEAKVVELDGCKLVLLWSHTDKLGSPVFYWKNEKLPESFPGTFLACEPLSFYTEDENITRSIKRSILQGLYIYPVGRYN